MVLTPAERDRYLELLAESELGKVLVALTLAARQRSDPERLTFAITKRGALSTLDNEQRLGILTKDDFKAQFTRLLLDVTRFVQSCSLEPDAGAPVVEPPQPEPRNVVCLTCRDVEKRFGDHFRLPRLSFTLRFGQILGVIGLNGAGKTTLLRLIAGDLSVSGGALTVSSMDAQGRPLQNPGAYVSQTPEAWSGTLEQYLRLRAAFFGFTGDANVSVIDDVTALLGLAKYRERQWHELSGGYRMRVAIAAALVARPGLLVLDEPLAPLDWMAQQRLLDELKIYATAAGAAMVISSQHVPEVESIADLVLLLDETATLEERAASRAVMAGELFEVATFLGGRPLKQRLEELKGRGVIRAFSVHQSNAIIESDSTTMGDMMGQLGGTADSISYLRDVSRSAMAKVYRRNRQG